MIRQTAMNKVQIIAEAGVNHNGDIGIAKKIVDAAKESGADAVKFQTFDVKSLVSERAEMADYQKRNLGIDESQEKMLARLALTREEFLSLASYCKETGISFMSTPFDVGSIMFLNPLQEVWKVPSGEITNYPYLVEIARTGKNIILSTGMSTMDEVQKAWEVLRENGCGEMILLHCTTEYPAPMETVNLRAMLTLRESFGCEVGYSDHTRGMEAAIAAVAMGACVIEKHLTLDRSMAGPDHRASLEPDELSALVKAIRNVEKALGDGIKAPPLSEMANRSAARKSIIAAQAIKQGELLTEDNLTTKRPGTGISPMQWNEVLGTKAIRDFRRDELIEI